MEPIKFAHTLTIKKEDFEKEIETLKAESDKAADVEILQEIEIPQTSQKDNKVKNSTIKYNLVFGVRKGYSYSVENKDGSKENKTQDVLCCYIQKGSAKATFIGKVEGAATDLPDGSKHISVKLYSSFGNKFIQILNFYSADKEYEEKFQPVVEKFKCMATPEQVEARKKMYFDLSPKKVKKQDAEIVKHVYDTTASWSAGEYSIGIDGVEDTEIKESEIMETDKSLKTGKYAYAVEVPTRVFYPFVNNNTKTAYIVAGESLTEAGKHGLYFLGAKQYEELCNKGFDPAEDFATAEQLRESKVLDNTLETSKYNKENIKEGKAAFVIAGKTYVDGNSISIKRYKDQNKTKVWRLPVVDKKTTDATTGKTIGIKEWFDEIKDGYFGETTVEKVKIVEKGHAEASIPLKIASTIVAAVLLVGASLGTAIGVPVSNNKKNAKKQQQIQIAIDAENEAKQTEIESQTKALEALDGEAYQYGRQQMMAIVGNENLLQIADKKVSSFGNLNTILEKENIDVYQQPEEYNLVTRDYTTETFKGAASVLGEKVAKELVDADVVVAESSTISTQAVDSNNYDVVYTYITKDVKYSSDSKSMSANLKDNYKYSSDLADAYVTEYEKGFADAVATAIRVKGEEIVTGTEVVTPETTIDYSADAVKSAALDKVSAETKNGGKLDDVTIAYTDNEKVAFAYGGDYIYKFEFADGTTIESNEDFVNAIKGATVTEGVNTDYLFLPKYAEDLASFKAQYIAKNYVSSAAFFIANYNNVIDEQGRCTMSPTMIVLRDNGASIQEVSLDKVVVEENTNAKITTMAACAMGLDLPAGYSTENVETKTVNYSAEDNKIETNIELANEIAVSAETTTDKNRDR